jgi:hypothetical protein
MDFVRIGPFGRIGIHRKWCQFHKVARLTDNGTCKNMSPLSCLKEMLLKWRRFAQALKASGVKRMLRGDLCSLKHEWWTDHLSKTGSVTPTAQNVSVGRRVGSKKSGRTLMFDYRWRYRILMGSQCKRRWPPFPFAWIRQPRESCNTECPYWHFRA